jgi:hypothetical protein
MSVTNSKAPKSRMGYHYNALANASGVLLGETLAVECIVQAKQAFKNNADNTLRRQFIQKRLAETYKEEVDEINIISTTVKIQLDDEWNEEGGFCKGRPIPGSLLTDEMRERTRLRAYAFYDGGRSAPRFLLGC